MKKLFIQTLSLFTFFQLNSQVQLQNARQGESVEYCTTHKKMNALKQNPAFVQQFQLDQNVLQIVEQQMREDVNHTRQIYTIPIVFHVLHNGGVENISKEQIQDALDVLNRDYRKLNADTNQIISEFSSSNPNAIATPADIEIQFVMATKAPNGTCFSGITRTQSTETNSGDGQTQLTAIKNGNDVFHGEWPGNKYLNVFICKNIGGAAGYTMNPSQWVGTNMANGIYVLQDYVGRIGTSSENTSRTLTHEIGHWLNLDHVWGNTNDPGVGCGDDQVSDTPITKGFTFCPSSTGAKVCNASIVENYQNYMDYSYCSLMFTHGQKSRMVAALNSSVGGRNNIWTSTNLTAVGANGNAAFCVADFYADKTTICSGSTIHFFDNSYNNVSSWNWSFPGAATTSSTDQNPVIVYDTSGTYTVTLIASDGSSNITKTKTQYITVTAAGVSLPFLDGFEPYATTFDAGTFWETFNQQNNATFQVSSSAGQSSSKSAVLNNFGQAGTNLDELISDPVDLSEITANGEVTLSFRFSYRKKTTATNEALYVLMTGNCGDTWSIKKSLQGSSLSSLTSSTAWVPNQTTDWTTVHVTNITSAFWNENFRFKFRFEGNTGNNLYLDNINIYKAAPSEELIGTQFTGIEENKINQSLMLFPNPVDNELNISYSVNDNALTSIRIVDVLGQTIDQKTIHSAVGDNLVVLGTEGLASGIYTAQITIAGVNYNKQFIVK